MALLRRRMDGSSSSNSSQATALRKGNTRTYRSFSHNLLPSFADALWNTDLKAAMVPHLLNPKPATATALLLQANTAAINRYAYLGFLAVNNRAEGKSVCSDIGAA
jgi:hypothetical protein